MSNQRKKIEKFCKENGIIIEELIWRHLGRDIEMCGLAGGWMMIDDELEYYFGNNVDELIANIKLTVELKWNQGI
jgi:hypothetical protein